MSYITCPMCRVVLDIDHTSECPVCHGVVEGHAPPDAQKPESVNSADPKPPCEWPKHHFVGMTCIHCGLTRSKALELAWSQEYGFNVRK